MSNRARTALNRAKSRSDDTLATIIAVVVVVVGLTLLFGGLMALGAVLTKFAWNYGVVAIVAACGGYVAKITFLTALAFNIAWGIVTRPFRRTTTTTENA